MRVRVRIRSRIPTGERGVTTVLVAILVIVLFGCTALVVDVGRMYEERRELQRTADVAAMSGAQQLPASKADADTTAKFYVTENPSVHHEVYDEETDDVITQRLQDGDQGCPIELNGATHYLDCVDVTVRARAFDFLLAPVLGFDGRHFKSDGSGNPIGAKATAVVGSGALGGEKLVPWVVVDCPDETYDGHAGDSATYDEIVAKVNNDYPGRCPYEFSLEGWGGPREELFLDTGGQSSGNFQGADLKGEPCPPPNTPDGLFPHGGGGNEYWDLLAGLASDDVVPCHTAKGARVYPETGVLSGPTKQGLSDRGVSTLTCANEDSFNATVRDRDGDGIYQILDHDNPCLVGILLTVHVDPVNGAVETDVPGASRIIEFQHTDAIDADNNDQWRFAPPSKGSSKPLLLRRLAFFYITSPGPPPGLPVEGLFLRALDSANAELDGTACTDKDGVCVVKLAG
ncbi:MAG: pilus assembly protein TadG-related protein [Actinomycetota bacterium]|nr:pilus assembly protein TadG-related protein [Actinomycetota bacterium]